MGKPSRLPKTTQHEDIAAFAALRAINNYHPNNADFDLTRISGAYDAMIASQTEEVQKQAAAAAAEDAAQAAEHRFHQMMLGTKDQIKSQFGDNSDEYASLGRKKKDDFRPRRRRVSKKTDNPI